MDQAVGVELNTKPVGARNFPFGHLVNCCFNLGFTKVDLRVADLPVRQFCADAIKKEICFERSV